MSADRHGCDFILSQRPYLRFREQDGEKGTKDVRLSAEKCGESIVTIRSRYRRGCFTARDEEGRHDFHKRSHILIAYI